MLPIILFADRNSAANVWLRENPLVLSAIAVVIGLALLFFGITGLTSGSTQGKFGNTLSGGSATAVSVVRLIGGIGAILFAIYVAMFGAW